MEMILIMTIQNKIDFKLIFTVDTANPNGDPLNGNRPRTNSKGYGEMTDVSIKRKLRNRAQELGQEILIQSNGRETDEFRDIKSRIEGNEELTKLLQSKDKKDNNYNDVTGNACETWYDVRAFGQVLTYKGKSITGITGPVSIQMPKSQNVINIRDFQITKSVNGEVGEGKGSDTMGMKSVVDFGLYVLNGSISPYGAERTGFTDEDAEILKQSLLTIFENDESSARPAGSMNVRELYWWEHPGKIGNSFNAHNSVKINQKSEEPDCYEDFDIVYIELDNVKAEIHRF